MLMMLVVIDGGVDPFAYPGVGKSGRVEFKSKMTVHIVGHHDEQK